MAFGGNWADLGTLVHGFYISNEFLVKKSIYVFINNLSMHYLRDWGYYFGEMH